MSQAAVVPADRLLLTPAEAGWLLGVSDDSVRLWIAEHKLAAIYPFGPGRGVKVARRHVEAFAQRLADDGERERLAALAADREMTWASGRRRPNGPAKVEVGA